MVNDSRLAFSIQRGLSLIEILQLNPNSYSSSSSSSPSKMYEDNRKGMDDVL